MEYEIRDVKAPVIVTPDQAVSLFLRACCHSGAWRAEGSTVLYRAYEKWAAELAPAEHQHPLLTHKAFVGRLKAKGYLVAARRGTLREVHGLALRPVAERVGYRAPKPLAPV